MPSLDFSWGASPQAWIAFATLFGLEVVLGIDNIIFISILSGKLPVEQRAKARTLGLSLAMITRILLLLLSLSFLLLIGVTLVAEGLQIHIPKGFIYFAMAFALAVEMLNLRLRKGHEPPVALRGL